MTTLTAPKIKLRKRYAVAEWQLDETHFAVLSVSHSTDVKAFGATLRQEKQHQYDGYMSRSFMLFDGLRIGREPVKRYSDKAMVEYLDRMVATVEYARREGNPDVTQYFTLPETEEDDS